MKIEAILNSLKRITDEFDLEFNDHGKWYEYLSELQEDSDLRHTTKGLFESLGRKDFFDLIFDIYSLHLRYVKNRDNFSANRAALVFGVIDSGSKSNRLQGISELFGIHPTLGFPEFSRTVKKVTDLKRRELNDSLSIIVSIFTKHLLPGDRVLRDPDAFAGELSKKKGNGKFIEIARVKKLRDYLALIAFEVKVRHLFTLFLNSCEELLLDKDEHIQNYALSALARVLMKVPEREDIVLKILVNKLGSTLKAVNLRVVKELERILAEHPHMLPFVLKEVENVIFRPKVNSRARFYGIVFLSNAYRKSKPFLSREEFESVGQDLSQIFFLLFKVVTKDKEPDQRLLRAIVTGVNVVASSIGPGMMEEKLSEHIDEFFKMSHVSPFPVKYQVLKLLSNFRTEVLIDRFYRTLYESLLDRDFPRSKLRKAFLNLVFKNIRDDIDSGDDDRYKRAVSFLRRLLQVSYFQTPNFIALVLVLISKLDLDTKKVFAVVPHDESPREDGGKDAKEEKTHYDYTYRDGRFAGSTTETIWEISSFIGHYHRSVSIFAEKLVKGEKIGYSGEDPIEDFGSRAYLEKFSRKRFSPAKVEKKKQP